MVITYWQQQGEGKIKVSDISVLGENGQIDEQRKSQFIEDNLSDVIEEGAIPEFRLRLELERSGMTVLPISYTVSAGDPIVVGRTFLICTKEDAQVIWNDLKKRQK